MKLYELSTDFSRLFDDFDAICSYEPEKSESGDYIDDGGSIIEDLAAYRQELQEAWFDTLDGIEQEFEDKAENVAAYIKSLKAEADDLKEEEAALNRRRKVKENQIDRLKDAVEDMRRQLSEKNARILFLEDNNNAFLEVNRNQAHQAQRTLQLFYMAGRDAELLPFDDKLDAVLILAKLFLRKERHDITFLHLLVSNLSP